MSNLLPMVFWTQFTHACNILEGLGLQVLEICPSYQEALFSINEQHITQFPLHIHYIMCSYLAYFLKLLTQSLPRTQAWWRHSFRYSVNTFAPSGLNARTDYCKDSLQEPLQHQTKPSVRTLKGLGRIFMVTPRVHEITVFYYKKEINVFWELTWCLSAINCNSSILCGYQFVSLLLHFWSSHLPANVPGQSSRRWFKSLGSCTGDPDGIPGFLLMAGWLLWPFGE